MFMFITYEGPDGSGKSTQAKELATALEKAGHRVELVHFPRYEGTIGKLIGEIIRGEKEIKNFDALEMLYVDDQLDWQKDLKELLYDEHKIVIADRYDMSTIAYYASKTGCEIPEAMDLIRSRWQYGFIQPDVTFLMTFNGDLDKRRAGMNKEKDLFETDDNVLSSINETYQILSERMHTRYVVTLDGNNTKEENANIALNEVNNMLEKNKQFKIKDSKLFKNERIKPF